MISGLVGNKKCVYRLHCFISHPGERKINHLESSFEYFLVDESYVYIF